ncbi:MAG: carboxypeptidase regulatory-like domain-containing protein, partial [Acidobacteria bacterium]|nr:carboxypeptidase regulatory-like domain-containing protein [Acidobacteriota bacterium]
MKFIRSFIGMSMLALVARTTALAQQTGEISGDVTDSVGATVVGASVKVTDSKGVEKNTVTASNGRFKVNGLAPGKYTVVISSPSFAVYENTEVDVKA